MPSPDEVLKNWKGIENNDFQSTIRSTFGLPEDDDYVYHADAFAMTLAQVQEKLSGSPLKYTYSMAHKVIEITQADIEAYTSMFAPNTDTSKTLTSFLSNAKKTSPRENVAQYLSTQRLVPSTLRLTKSKVHPNPYFDVWVYTCRATGFVGPLSIKEYADPQSAKMTHPLLPVLYHHFGCVCPSYEGLSIIKQLVGQNTGTKGVLDMASGNGYWTYMLRRLGLDVVAVDNMESEWRYNWVEDTIQANGVEWVKKNGGAADRVLLMVYMVTKGDFTKNVLKAYKGDAIVVVGTQNANKYTSFRDVGVQEYFEREMKGFELTTRVALPSFAGKDEAMFVFQRKA